MFGTLPRPTLARAGSTAARTSSFHCASGSGSILGLLSLMVFLLRSARRNLPQCRQHLRAPELELPQRLGGREAHGQMCGARVQIAPYRRDALLRTARDQIALERGERHVVVPAQEFLGLEARASGIRVDAREQIEPARDRRRVAARLAAEGIDPPQTLAV